MKNVLLICLFVILAHGAFAQPPNKRTVEPLRALWVESPIGGTSCQSMMLLESGRTYVISNNFVRTTSPDISTLLVISGKFATTAEAEDWLIQLFIRLNQLDATLADVPIDGTGARDCRSAWNTQLIQ